MGRRLVVADHVVFFQAAGDAGSLAVPHLDDDLVGFGIPHRSIAGHFQAAIVKRFGKRFGIGDNSRLVLLLEGVHLHGGGQQSQQGAQVVVAHGTGKSAPADGLPQLLAQLIVLRKIGRHHAPLRAEEGFVGGAGDQVGSLGERLLKMGPQQSQDMGHVIHQDRGQAQVVDQAADRGHRFLVQDHAFAHDDQFGSMTFHDGPAGIDIHLVGVVGQDRKIDHRWKLGMAVADHKITQGAHRLGRQVAPLDDVVVHDASYAALFGFAIGAVEKIDHGGEDHHIGHLTGDGPGLYLAAVQIGLHLFGQRGFHGFNEIRALVIEDFGVGERFNRLVLGIAADRIHDREQAHQRRKGHLGRYQVDALLLPPDGVINGFLDPLAELLGRGGGRLGLFALLAVVLPGIRTGQRRRFAAQQVGHDAGMQLSATDIDLHLGRIRDAAVDQCQSDGPALGAVGDIR